MQHPQKFWQTRVGMALVLWLCSLPLVALLVFPFWGPRVALVTAAILLLVLLLVCWILCSARTPESGER